MRKCNWRKRTDLSLLQNNRFGKLLVVNAFFDEVTHKTLCECKCDCGNIKTIQGGLLLRGIQTSCDCKRKEYGKNKSIWKGCGDISGNNWGRIERNARRRKIPFELTIEDGWNLFLTQNKKCALSGDVLHFNDRSSTFTDRTTSLDRIDSSKGYIKGNVQWVHKDINMMKQGYEQDKFIELCKKVANYH
jgi:hypothetical protein